MSRFLNLCLMTAGLMSVCGCSLWNQTQEANYQTLQANPQHDTEEAIEQHEKALKIIDRHTRGKHHHADLEKAEEHLNKALTADITYGPAHNSLGMLYLWQHKLYLAAWEYEYAIKVMPDQIEPIYNLALVYEEANKPDQAIMYLEQAYGLNPKDPHVIGSLARLRIKNGESLEAVRPLIKELVFYESRPDWINWANDMLGEHPVKMVSSEDEELTPEEDSYDEEESSEPVLEPLPPLPLESIDKSSDEPEDQVRFPDTDQSWKRSISDENADGFVSPINLPDVTNE